MTTDPHPFLQPAPIVPPAEWFTMLFAAVRRIRWIKR